MWNDIWSILWLAFWAFAWIAYLFVLIYILADIFRDKSLNGWYKAIWMIFLVFMPFLTAIVYLLVRGSGMGERAAIARNTEVLSEDRAQIHATSFANPADEIAKAQALREQGTITDGEFEAIKAKALGDKF
ncbi:MAG: PLDc N-terminal domain-containing protein [Leifsonia sp.]